MPSPDAHDQWIFDSGATCHMCNNKAMFSEVHSLCNPINVMLGDGRNLRAVGRGNVILTMKVHDKTKCCTLHDVLLVPYLAYNLLSVPAGLKKGKKTTSSNDSKESKFNGQWVNLDCRSPTFCESCVKGKSHKLPF